LQKFLKLDTVKTSLVLLIPNVWLSLFIIFTFFVLGAIKWEETCWLSSTCLGSSGITIINRNRLTWGHTIQGTKENSATVDVDGVFNVDTLPL